MQTFYTYTFLLLFLTNIQFINAQGFVQSPYQGLFISGHVVADFNGDGSPDVFGIDYNFNGDNVPHLLLNKNISGEIAFEEPILFQQFDIQGKPGAADMDADGDIDLVASLGPNLDLYLLRNDGNGDFDRELLGFSGTKDIKIADLDGDAKLDIIAVNFESDLVVTYSSNGFASYSETVESHEGENLSSFDFGDINLDGKTDIILGFDHYEGDQIVALLSSGFGFTDVGIARDEFEDLMDIEMADLNGDGELDIIAIEEDACVVWFSDGGWPSFDKETLFENQTGSEFRSLTIGDYDGNDLLDIVVGTNQDGLLWHQIISVFPFESNEVKIADVSPVFTILNADLDNDDDLDLVVSNGEFWWFENQVEPLPNAVRNQLWDAITIFPNPAKNFIKINNLPFEANLNLSNISGKILLRQPIVNGSNINLNGFDSGIYFLDITSEEESNFKIIKKVIVK